MPSVFENRKEYNIFVQSNHPTAYTKCTFQLKLLRITEPFPILTKLSILSIRSTTSQYVFFHSDLGKNTFITDISWLPEMSFIKRVLSHVTKFRFMIELNRYASSATLPNESAEKLRVNEPIYFVEE